MSVRPCPKCQAPTVRALERLNKVAYVNYYRCEHCGHVWTLPKGAEDNATPTDVTHSSDKVTDAQV